MNSTPRKQRAVAGLAAIVLITTCFTGCGSDTGIVKDLVPETTVDTTVDHRTLDLPSPDLTVEVVTKDQTATADVPDLSACPDCGDIGTDAAAGEVSGNVCGNGVCQAGEPAEDSLLCPEDCGPCGDGVCGPVEATPQFWCAIDCATACGNGECEEGEVGTPGGDGVYCPPDCGGCFDGCCGYQDLFNPDLAECMGADCAVTCGDGACSGSESWQQCPVDCGWCGDGVCGLVWDQQEPCSLDCVKPCGDGLCNGNESAESCAVDCGPCGDGVCGLKEMVAETCLSDCPPECGDDECWEGETEEECPGDCACLPECGDNWQCGEDAAGCGQMCGACPAGSTCQGHKCCVPDCMGKQCGDDGCGGSCGECAAGSFCEDGVCLCAAGCGDQECGVDPCGMPCGDCDDGIPCTADTCVDGVCDWQIDKYYCAIDGICWLNGTTNPLNPCQECKDTSDSTGWSDKANNTPCAPGTFCQNGECDGACIPDCEGFECGDDYCGGSCGGCDDGLDCTLDYCDVMVCVYKPQAFLCAIAGQCYFWGAQKPGEPCQVCDPTQEQEDWSPQTGPVSCALGKVCHEGACCDAAGHCVGLECGDDGCGGVCGECPPGEACVAGTCNQCDDGNDVNWDGCTDGQWSEFGVNQFTAHNQGSPAASTLNNGGFVLAWHSFGQEEADHYSNIVARVYGADGTPLADEFVVNTTTFESQSEVAVSHLASGGFVVVWSGFTQEDLGMGPSIVGRVFSSNGVALGQEFLIAPSSGDLGPGQPTTVPLSSGDFVVVWRTAAAATGWDVQGVILDEQGDPVTSVFDVNTSTAEHQYNPAVAVFGDDRFVVSWASEIDDGNSVHLDVAARMFNGQGVSLTGEIAVNQQESGNQNFPAVAALGTDAFVVAWQDDGLFGGGAAISARRFQSGGAAIDDAITVAIPLPDNLDNTAPAIDFREDGTHLVAYARETQGVAVAEYTLEGLETETVFTANSAPYAAGEYLPDVAYFRHGQAILVWEAPDLDGDGLGIFARRVLSNGQTCAVDECVIDPWDPACPGGCDDGNPCSKDSCDVDIGCVHELLDGTPCDDLDPCNGPGICVAGACTNQEPLLCDDGNQCTLDECVPGQGCQFLPDDFKPCDDGNLCTEQDFCAAGDCLAESPKNTCQSFDLCKAPVHEICYPNLGCTYYNVTGAACTDGLVCTTDDTCVDGACVGLTDACDDCNTCTQDQCDEQGCSNTQAPDGTQCDWDGSCQDGVCEAGDQQCEDGNTVDWDGCTDEMISEFQLAPGYSVPGDPEPVRFIGAGDGGYVAVWQAEEGALNSGIAYRRFAPDGTALSDVAWANETSAGDQRAPTACALSGGGFVIAWEGAGEGDADGVFMTLFDPSWNALETEIRMNEAADYVSGAQTGPELAPLNNGGFLAAWSSYGQDGDSYAVVARLYDAQGNSVGDEFVVNDIPDGVQSSPALAASGNTVMVVWRDKLPSATTARIRGRIVHSDGLMADAHVLSLFATQEHDAPDVASLESGKFVVVWERGMVAFNPLIYGRFLFDDGAPVGNEFGIVCDKSDGNNMEPAVTAMSNGNFVVAWQGGRGVEPQRIYIQTMDSDGNRLGQVNIANRFLASDRYSPGVEAIAGDQFVAGWTGRDDDELLRVWLQRFAQNGKKIYH